MLSFGAVSQWTANGLVGTNATYPTSSTINQILYSSATNTITGLATANRAVFTTSSSGVPAATALATDGQLIIGSTAGAPAAATLTAGTGVTITNGSNSITLNSVGGGLTWSDTSGTVNAASNHGYFISGTTTSTLPAAPTNGDQVAYIVDTASILTVKGNTGQKIRVGSAISASAGTTVNSVQGDSIVLQYRSTGTTWICLSAPQGVWTTT